MKLKRYLIEITAPSVDMATQVLEVVFKDVRSLLTKIDAFDIDDHMALKILKTGFDKVGVKLEMGSDLKSVKKYISSAEFGGKYGSDYHWLIKMKPGFSDIFKRFATSKGWKYMENPTKNPLMRELVDTLSHEILHTKQALGSGGAAFDPELQGMQSTYTGNLKDYLKNPIEIEPFAQQAAIDTIRMGEKNSPIIKNYKSSFPSGSKTLKKFLKKYSLYLIQLKKEGDITPFK